MTTYRAVPNGPFFASVSTVLTGRTRTAPQPVRSGSRRAGSFESSYWTPCKKVDMQKILLAARRYEIEGRGRGQRNGPLGTVALEVLALFISTIRFRTGRLDPSLTYLMSRLKRSKAAVVRALAALRDHGFLDWVRRYEPVERDGAGPQRRQLSNAYRLSLPKRAAKLIQRWFGRPAMPDDVLTAELERKQDYQHKMSSISLTEYVGIVAASPRSTEHDAFAAALLETARNMDELRESAKRSEYPA